MRVKLLAAGFLATTVALGASIRTSAGPCGARNFTLAIGAVAGPATEGVAAIVSGINEAAMQQAVIRAILMTSRYGVWRTATL